MSCCMTCFSAMQLQMVSACETVLQMLHVMRQAAFSSVEALGADDKELEPKAYRSDICWQESRDMHILKRSTVHPANA